MFQVFILLAGLKFLTDPASVAAYTRPLTSIMHHSKSVRESPRLELRYSAFETSEEVRRNISSYEIARNERLLFDRDSEKPLILTEPKQVRRRYGGYPRVQRALTSYRDIHGDMHVPPGYVVPDDIYKWPEEIWGMHLGSVVKKIRSGLYYSNKREDLERIGFCFEALQTKYTVAKAALLTYQKLNGDMLVPSKFAIPKESEEWPGETWGLNLGALVSNIRSGGSFAEKREELINLGFYFNTRIARFELVKLALLKYRDLYGDMLVAQSFVVPQKSRIWPRGSWGMNLGSIVHGIRGGSRYVEKKEELEALGFDYGSQKAIYGYNLAKMALLKYKQTSESGDMRVPYNFVIPKNDDSWPEEMWGMDLGLLVNNIKKGNYADKREDLLDMGFSYDPFQSKYTLVRKTLIKYKQINGDLLVPRQYVVPDDDERWPRESRRMKLGMVVYNIRGGSSYADQRDDLISIGFCYDALKAKYDILKRSLLRYKELYGDMLVPKYFVVPNDDNEWPSDLWGMKLGIAVRNVRGKKGSFSDKKEELVSLGFVYTLSKRFDYECVRIAVFKYRELYHGSVRVPAVYNIPENDPWYPEETWGMCLGSIVNSIKHGDKWPEKRYELLGDY